MVGTPSKTMPLVPIQLRASSQLSQVQLSRRITPAVVTASYPYRYRYCTLTSYLTFVLLCLSIYVCLTVYFALFNSTTAMDIRVMKARTNHWLHWLSTPGELNLQLQKRPQQETGFRKQQSACPWLTCLVFTS